MEKFTAMIMVMVTVTVMVDDGKAWRSRGSGCGVFSDTTAFCLSAEVWVACLGA